MESQTSLAHDNPFEHWTDFTALIEGYFRKRFHNRGDAFVGDLVAVAEFRFLVALREKQIRDPRRFLFVICRFVAIDAIRALRRRAAISDESLEAEWRERVAHDPLDEVRQRFCWVVLKYFRKERSACYAIARFVFRGRTLEDFAGKSGEPASRVRKRWSRCMQYARTRFGGQYRELGE